MKMIEIYDENKEIEIKEIEKTITDLIQTKRRLNIKTKNHEISAIVTGFEKTENRLTIYSSFRIYTKAELIIEIPYECDGKTIGGAGVRKTTARVNYEITNLSTWM
jgi:hypothetical protein